MHSSGRDPNAHMAAADGHDVDIDADALKKPRVLAGQSTIVPDSDFFHSRPAFLLDPLLEFAQVETKVAQSCLVRSVTLNMLEHMCRFAQCTETTPLAVTPEQSGDAVASSSSVPASASATPVHHNMRHAHYAAAMVSLSVYLLQVVNTSPEITKLTADTAPWVRGFLRKCRLWQTLCILIPGVVDPSVVSDLHDLAWVDWCRPSCKNEFRQYMEVFLMHCITRQPRELLNHRLISELAKSTTMPVHQASSLLVIVGFVFLRLSPEDMQHQGSQLLYALTPWLTVNYGQSRTVAQYLWVNMYEVYFGISPPPEFAVAAAAALKAHGVNASSAIASAIASLPTPDPVLMQLYQFNIQHIDAIKVRRRHTESFRNFNPDRLCSLAGHMSEMGASGPTFMQLLNDASCSIMSELKVINDGEESQLAWMPKERVRDVPLVAAPSLSSAADDFQRKILPLQDLLAESNEEARARDLVVSSVRGRKRHDMIVVASLVDRIPNLAGLARTCEIFNAAKLVMHDLSVVQDDVFVGISVTAHLWLPMEEVLFAFIVCFVVVWVCMSLDSQSPARIRSLCNHIAMSGSLLMSCDTRLIQVKERNVGAYLTAQKRAGYTIIALEQTANSISLEQYEFPEKVVLLLGKEKEGIPVHLVQLVDCCIEIPQFGLLRSLNVHVSGAILIWSFVRQHALLGSSTETATQAIVKK